MKTCLCHMRTKKGTDQPAHPRSLISAFVVPCLDRIIPLLAIAEFSRLCIVSVAAHASLGFTWSQTPKTGFPMLRRKLSLNWSNWMTRKIYFESVCYYYINSAASSEFGTYRLCEQRRFRRACASAQSRQNLRCSLIQAVSQEETSDRKPGPSPLWMAGHAQLKFVMTECSKTQIRLTRPSYWKTDRTIAPIDQRYFCLSKFTLKALFDVLFIP